ncbi:MAG: stage III sporulation protein AC [Alicyclobacillaceae bacterium]|jgi:stage III sporulation protein AC|uniref:stage III sporulation protein AC n=1 Tax=Alicyclobacillus sp. SP_1 TaxID=2942475 RepID=UPI0021581F2D|nr:stage III sporulation protein AC [Alicyclobacillus sp. SP_1]MCY0888945.1 stage III sporulation protein AC [Alicyclobacillaceae bacterium]MCY0896363.1 stage III sporulation protein AC [Alicyclobacillaceae bacterium]
MSPEVRSIFQIFGVGFVVAMMNALLRHSGREDFAQWTTLAGVIAVLVIVIGYVDHLYQEITRVFLNTQ